MNDTYLISSGDDKYVLRIYTYGFKTQNDISEELSLLAMLKKNDIGVSYPIADMTGNMINEIQAPEGNRSAVLFSYAEGSKVRLLTEDFNRSVGTLIGNMHQVTIDKTIERKDYSVKVLVGWAYGQLCQYFSEEIEEMQFIKACEPLLENAFESVPALRKGVVHLDVWYDNMNVQEDGTITLFDFDNVGNGWLVLDLGYYCMQRFHAEPEVEEYEKKRTAFIEAYRKIMPVTDEELTLMPYAGLAIWIHYLGVQAERFNKISNFFLSENYLKACIGMVKKWLKHHDIEVVV